MRSYRQEVLFVRQCGRNYQGCKKKGPERAATEEQGAYEMLQVQFLRMVASYEQEKQKEKILMLIKEKVTATGSIWKISEWEERLTDNFVRNVRKELFELWEESFQLSSITQNSFVTEGGEKDVKEFNAFLDDEDRYIDSIVNEICALCAEFIRMRRTTHLMDNKQKREYEIAHHGIPRLSREEIEAYESSRGKMGKAY